uniref:LamG-like jellyroll fold domain-containing protein n=1 Tax=uncultured Draconibacterium sp. TaxID=1573823 RepID=UPI003217AA0E
MQYFHRTNLLSALAGVLLFLLFPVHLFGKNSLSDLVFLTCETKGNNLQQELRDGYRAFIITSDASAGKVLDETAIFLNENKDEIILFIIRSEMPFFLKALEQHNVFQTLATPGEYSIDKLTQCRENGKRLFVFTADNTPFSYSVNDYLCEYNVPSEFPEEIISGFGESQGNDLVIYTHDKTISSLPDSLQQHPERIPQLLNIYTGKLPNFFITKNPETFSAYHQNFLEQVWYTANVQYNEEPLEGIRWKEMPLMLSYGKIHTTEVGLSPYKIGYHFTPDVFNFNNYTSESTKIFFARPKNLKDEMVLYLSFEQNIVNQAGESTEIPYKNVEYKKDSLRGWCGVFNGRDNYIDFDTDIVFNENFTVSVWVKPSEIDGNRSIIGKGKALSVKFRDGNMLFTSPGIKDHASDSAMVVPNKWQHLTYVISSGGTVKFYKNGQIIDTQKAERIEPTEHSLLVGTNLWDESFKGMMDDLAIWNRNLSDQEVMRLYEHGIEEPDTAPSPGYSWGLALTVVVALILLLYFVLKKKHKPASGIQTKPSNLNPLTKQLSQIKEPSVELFGGFKITNRNKEDLTARFSPKRKQIFILVLTETLRNKGITSKQLANHLWAGHSSESAKNNRSTQIQRIREVLDTSSGINIAYTNKKWVIDLSEDVYCDLAHYFSELEAFKQATSEVPNFEHLANILSIIEKGPLLPNMDDEWLDGFKSKISDDLLDTLLPLLLNDNFKSKTEWLLRLSQALLIFDPLNETVLAHKIKALIKLEKNTQAHECLEHFEKVYQQCYAQPFGKSISDLMV